MRSHLAPSPLLAVRSGGDDARLPRFSLERLLHSVFLCANCISSCKISTRFHKAAIRREEGGRRLK